MLTSPSKTLNELVPGKLPAKAARAARPEAAGHQLVGGLEQHCAARTRLTLQNPRRIDRHVRQFAAIGIDFVNGQGLHCDSSPRLLDRVNFQEPLHPGLLLKIALMRSATTRSSPACKVSTEISTPRSPVPLTRPIWMDGSPSIKSRVKRARVNCSRRSCQL